MIHDSHYALWPAARLVAALALLCAPLCAEVTDASVLKARNWDQPVVIGPGGWRGAKPITTENQKHKIEPGALVEKAHFDGKRNPQWEVSGALVRESKFNGDLGANFSAKDSAFEACSFYKTGAWFVDWWGTKWRFENCVISKSFMPGGFGVHDYSVRAADCTFVGVQLPSFGLKNPAKDDPATYVGKGDLQFLRCKFIGCEVPESALAASVDCVFQDCKFWKGKFAWEKGKTPLKVTAFIGAGRQPPSYTNGVLEVTFKAGAPPQPAGSKLQFTQAGERILIPWARQISKFQEIGVEDKLASSVPVFNVATNNVPPPKETPPPAPAKEPPAPAVEPPPSNEPPPAGPRPVTGPNSFLNLPGADPAPKPKQEPPAPAPAPAAAPVEKALRTFDELLAALPIDLNLLTNAKINSAAVDLANAALDKAATGKPAIFRVTVEELRGFKENGYAFAVISQAVPLRVKTLPAVAKIHAHFRASHAATLSRVGKGNALNIRGIVSKAEISGNERNLTLRVIIDEAETQ